MQLRNRKKCKTFARTACSLAAMAACWPAAAHHSAAMFDDTKCQAVTGTVRNLQWQYPHSWLWLVVPNSKGETDIWGFEMPEPAGLTRSPNWSRDALTKGEKITVHFAPLRDGRNAGLANAVLKADGKALHAAPNAFGCESKLWTPGPGGSPGEAVFKG